MEAAIEVEINKAAKQYKAKGNIKGAINSIGVAATLKELYQKCAISEARLTYKALKKSNRKSVGFSLGLNDVWNRAVDTYLMQHNIFNTVERINDTTKKRVLEIISRGVQDGKSVDQIVEDLENDDIPLMRAKLIVRTESTGAMNVGNMMGAISTGIIYDKKWNTCKDERVRTAPFPHTILDGVIKAMDEPYQNGEAIMYPGDKRASASNFIQCRCNQSFIAKRDANGRIMRYPENDTRNPNTPGSDKRINDILFQLIIGQILAGQIQHLVDDDKKP